MTITNFHQDQQRNEYALTADGHRCYIQYRERDGVVYLTYSFVPPALRGKGVGQQLVEMTYNDLTEQGKQVVAVCPFIGMAIQRMENGMN